jgi:hypothetical protein
MTPFSAYILTNALLLGLLVCSLIWLFKTSRGAIWIKIALALALTILVCWSPLATRAILGYPQPRALGELPDRFQLFAEHSVDDQSFDLWIERVGENEPLAVTIVPDKQMRSLLRSAQQKLGQGAPVILSRSRSNADRENERNKTGDVETGASADGAQVQTGLNDDQTRWTLDIQNIKWRKNDDQ